LRGFDAGAGLHGQCDADLIEQRCFLVKGEEAIPIFDEYGLAAQLGNVEYARPRKFREKLEQWLRAIQVMWPECPARMNATGTHVLLKNAVSIRPR
jgi:hypothetical protein